jgi:hypothetical protein
MIKAIPVCLGMDFHLLPRLLGREREDVPPYAHPDDGHPLEFDAGQLLPIEDLLEEAN